MFLSQGGLIPDWTTGKVSTFSSWLLPIHLPILSLATQTHRHTHTHTHTHTLLSEPCWNTCCQRNRPGCTSIFMSGLMHVSLSPEGYTFPLLRLATSPSLHDSTVTFSLGEVSLSYQAKWGTPASRAPASHSLMFPLQPACLVMIIILTIRVIKVYWALIMCSDSILSMFSRFSQCSLLCGLTISWYVHLLPHTSP